jgi:uncharacterized protein (TIGR02246 family)
LAYPIDLSKERTDMEDHPQLTALLHDWSAAEAANDAASMERLITDDFAAVGPRGFVLDRQAWLDRYRSSSLKISRFELREPAARVYGDTALTIVEQQQEATFEGHDASGRFRATFIAVRTDGRWRFAGVHLSSLAGPQS